MERRSLGSLEVSSLGLGCGPLGDERLGDDGAAAVLHAALDEGITFFDTARSYGASEERVGRALRGRDVVIATKGGYGVEGAQDWTPDAIRLGIEGALRRIGVERLGVFFLHSCDIGTMERVVEELGRAKAAGKIALTGYSGDEESLAWAIASRRFDVVECSLSLFDQAAIGPIAMARSRGVGVVTKRSLANAAAASDVPPEAHDRRIYWERARALALADASPETLLRFAAHVPGVSTSLVGTTRAEHVRVACRAIRRGPLDEPVAREIAAAWARHGKDWPGVV